MSDWASLAVRDTSGVESIIKGASWACNDRRAFGAVASLGTGDQLEVGSARLTVVAGWAVLTDANVDAALIYTEFAGEALRLHSASAVGAFRATVLVRRAFSAHLWAQVAVSARGASFLTPSTVGGVGAHLDIIISIVDPVPCRDRRAVLLAG